jgi:hypothetical protein
VREELPKRGKRNPYPPTTVLTVPAADVISFQARCSAVVGRPFGCLRIMTRHRDLDALK